MIPIATVESSVAQSMTTHGSFVDVTSMTVTITAIEACKLLCLATIETNGVDANHEQWSYRFLLDGATAGEEWMRQRWAAPTLSEVYTQAFHTVFAGVGVGTHTIKLQVWSTDEDLSIGNRQLTVLAVPDADIYSIYASADDTHTTNITWEDINSMSLAVSLASQKTLLQIFTTIWTGVSANPESADFRTTMDASTGVDWRKYRGNNPADSEHYCSTIHDVFASVAAGNHTSKAQWYATNLDTTIKARRLTVIALADSQVLTASETAADAHTANNTWETVNNMSNAFTPVKPVDVVSLFSVVDDPTVSTWLYIGHRVALDLTSYGQTYRRAKAANPRTSEEYLQLIHGVFPSVSAAAHTVTGRWWDLGSSSNCEMDAKRLTTLLLDRYPSIITPTPIAATVGDSIIITGSYFNAVQGAGTITVNGVAATVTAWSDTSITITVPNTTTGNIVVTNSDGYVSTGWAITITAAAASTTGTSPVIGGSGILDMNSILGNPPVQG